MRPKLEDIITNSKWGYYYHYADFPTGPTDNTTYYEIKEIRGNLNKLIIQETFYDANAGEKFDICNTSITSFLLDFFYYTELPLSLVKFCRIASQLKMYSPEEIFNLILEST